MTDDITYNDYVKLIRKELAHYLDTDIDNPLVDERLSEKDSQDIVQSSWCEYNNAQPIERLSRTRKQQQKWIVSSAANCISML